MGIVASDCSKFSSLFMVMAEERVVLDLFGEGERCLLILFLPEEGDLEEDDVGDLADLRGLPLKDICEDLRECFIKSE